MRYTLLEGSRDAVMLLARVLLMVLFVIFGWGKLLGFGVTVAYMDRVGVPMPTASAALAVIMELVVGVAITVGFYTRPLALLLCLYTLAAAIIGHQFWHMIEADRIEGMINFYKNVSIAGGLLLLSVAGPGRYSLDRR